jgi:DNA invertase Pin-like site-specific DNA recombinase
MRGYLRVSTKRQGKSGLGLEAQRHAVDEFLNGGNWSLVKEFVEVESGKRADRPQLEASLKACRAYGAKLVIAKLSSTVCRVTLTFCWGLRRLALILSPPICRTPTG